MLAISSVSLKAETASDGQNTWMPGAPSTRRLWAKLRMNARSGRPIWLGPSAASETPACDPQSLMLALEITAISSWS